jgi:hypothetical protein
MFSQSGNPSGKKLMRLSVPELTFNPALHIFKWNGDGIDLIFNRKNADLLPDIHGIAHRPNSASERDLSELLAQHIALQPAAGAAFGGVAYFSWLRS